jgi:methionyl-tRNA synthetase
MSVPNGQIDPEYADVINCENCGAVMSAGYECDNCGHQDDSNDGPPECWSGEEY